MKAITTLKQYSGGHLQVITDLKSTSTNLEASLEGIGGHLQAILELRTIVATLNRH